MKEQIKKKKWKGYEDFAPDIRKMTRIIEGTPNDTLVQGEFKEGKNIGIQFDEILKEGWQISPKVKITFTFIPNKDDFTSVKIIKYKREGSSWEEAESITLSSFGLSKISSLLEFIKGLDIKGITEKRIMLAEDSINLDEDTLKKLKTIFSDPSSTAKLQDLVEPLLSDENLVTQRDIQSIGYRKQQLEVFEKLLNDEEYLKKYKEHHDITKDGYEPVWQFYFEKNQWILGYGLNYIWCCEIDEGPIEKVVSGSTFFSKGKRTDGLLKTMAEIKKFVLLELKTPASELLMPESKPYRPECWRISDELSGGIAQVHKTKYKFLEQIKDKLQLEDEEGNYIGEDIYKFAIKSYLIVGNLEQLKGNTQKYSSFEMFRESISTPEIITFDELYNRAKYIIESGEKQ